MDFEVIFMDNAQKKTSEARLRANKKYSNSKWRPNVYIDKDRQEAIEAWIAEHGYKSFNEYVCALIDRDMSTDKPE